MADRPANAIPALSAIEFTGPKAIAKYSREGRQACRKLRDEFEGAAEDARAALKTLDGHPLLLGVDVKIKAWRVANRLRRAAECLNGAAIELVKFNADFRTHFIEPMAAAKKKPKFDLKDD